MILLDTNIFVEISKGNVAMVSIVEHIEKQNIVVSDISRAELFYGARDKMELKQLQRLINYLNIFPITPEVSTLAVKFVEAYCLSHKARILDMLIAATAIYYNVELYTLNVKDFIFIPGLKLYRP
jgi:predicted nucleic acid-binding protein